tara:strand:- start:583 stop:804 length:222 start_codon:yes stop_codon:yes gene_type:complete
MRLDEIASINEIWTDIARDLGRNLGRWLSRQSQSRINQIKKDQKKKSPQDNRSKKRSGGSDEYDYIIKKYRDS